MDCAGQNIKKDKLCGRYNIINSFLFKIKTIKYIDYYTNKLLITKQKKIL